MKNLHCTIIIFDAMTAEFVKAHFYIERIFQNVKAYGTMECVFYLPETF